jgi:hypothetical protein
MTIKHTAFVNPGELPEKIELRGLYSISDTGATLNNITIKNNYFAGSSTNLAFSNWDHGVIEGNYFASNWSNQSYSHGQQISPVGTNQNISIRNNIFTNTSTILLCFHVAGNSLFDIFNNIVVESEEGNAFNSFVKLEGAYLDVVDATKNINVHHNTLVNVNHTLGTFMSGSIVSDPAYRGKSNNNLLYNCRPVSFSANIDHDYNAFYDSTGVNPSEEHGIIGVGDPFVNSANGDFYLKNPISGVPLSAPFDVDMNNVTRGLDGIWDVGAYEYVHAAVQNTSLITGWNWISFNVLPDDLSLNSVFAGVLAQVEQVKAQTQSVIRSGGNWKGDLANMNGIGQYKMYKVKINANCTLTVTGTAITPTTPIALTTGWNWVAFLPTTSLPIATALASISGQVQKIKSLTQSAIYNGGAWSGTLTQLDPGQGYAIKMNGPGTLIYPAAAQSANRGRK